MSSTPHPPPSAVPAGWLLVLLLAGAGSAAAQSGCREIYPPTRGWALDLCTEDPNFGERMTVVLDGADEGLAKMVRVYHATDAGRRLPQVAVFNASGFVRLKQNADPQPPVPFGSSFILGPAYWPDQATYFHSPRLHRIELDTTALPTGPLRLVAAGDNGAFSVVWEMALPPPKDRQTRLHVEQTHTATAAVTIDPVRRGEAQGFKLVQVSSMFINLGGACDGGHVDCHDSNGARYIGADLARRERAFSGVAASGFIFPSPVPLRDTWLDALHGDDEGWQGNTPNVRIALDELPADHTITPQGYITATTDPNSDNVDLWLHDDGPGSTAWAAGESGRVAYWLIAQDDPPDPWADLGLRPGLTFLDFEGTSDCRTVVSSPAVQASLGPIAGYRDTALELAYDLGDLQGEWAQIRCDFSPPLDLSAFDHLRLEWRGDAGARNSLEVGAIAEVAGGERVFIKSWPSVTHRSWWGRLVLPFDFLDHQAFEPSRVVSLLVAVKNAVDDDQGGAGRLAIDNAGAWNVAARPVPERFEPPPAQPELAATAAAWLAQHQQPSGLVRSWEQDADCIAHTYTQALALITFAREGNRAAADALAGALTAGQNADGSWPESYDCGGRILSGNRWEGAIAWTVYALSRYLALGGSAAGAEEARRRGATWLADRLQGVGCLGIDHTEGTIDVWWALHAAGPAFTQAAAELEACLLAEYWDDEMGRFKGGRASWQPFLDNQTWGASFLHAIGRSGEARRALSYAWETLRQPARGGHLQGFDGQGGPWAVWNEGTAQYAAAGGPGSADLMADLLAQQRPDGALIAAPDPFEGAGVWDPRWYGIAPTAWLHFALTGEPFSCVPGRGQLCLSESRFRVEVSWRDFRGRTGTGRAEPLGGDSGYFWFFGQDNVELLVKVLDGCRISDHFWVFAAGLTNVEVDIQVTDTLTGAVARYHNPLGHGFPPIQDTRAFATCSAAGGMAATHPQPPHGQAAEDATPLVLGDGRFRVEVGWQTPRGATGPGHGVRLTEDTGYFWFFQPDNVELLVKILDGCGVNDHFWVFAGGLTNIGTTVSVVDLESGAEATYRNPVGTPFQPIQDTRALATCP